MSKKADLGLKLLGALALVPLSVLFVAGLVTLDGWILTKLWAWFVVTTFHLPPLTIAPAIGLTGTVGYLTHQRRPQGTWTEEVSHALGSSGMVLLIGWVVHNYFM